jgi:hypothetical protein
MCLAVSLSAFAKNTTESDVSIAIADESHELISRQLHQWIDDLDQFFGEERTMERRNSSQVLLRFDTTRFEDRYTWEPLIQARFDLPRTKRRLRLMLSSEAMGERSDSLGSTEQATQESIIDSFDTGSFSAALQFVFATTELFDINSRAGVSYKDGPDPFVSLRARAQTRFEKWNFRITQNIYFYTRQRFGEELLIDIERRLFDRFLLRLNSNTDWWQERAAFHSVNTASLIVPVTAKFALSFAGTSEMLPEKDWQIQANYLFAIARYRFYRHWAYIQIKPQIQYLREDDFSPVWSVTVGPEMIFGKN